MSLRKTVSLVIYRFRERGLEVFVLNDERQSEALGLPQGEMDKTSGPEMILLEPVEDGDQTQEAMAIEGDWHEIPSLKSMLYAMQLKEKLKSVEGGAFVSIKEALKKALPHQYQFLKELKDILTDRNSVRDL
jgi:hypothetical protein